MKLKHLRLPLAELKFKKAVRKMAPLLGVLPGYKRIHSLNVARRLHRAGVDKSGVYAGLAHDLLERGVKPEDLSRHVDELGLPKRVLKIVHALSNDEKTEGDENQVLQHLTSALQDTNLDADDKNLIILVKLSDRLDNLKRKQRPDSYKRQSIELIEFLKEAYSGDPTPFNKLYRKTMGFLAKAVKI